MWPGMLIQKKAHRRKTALAFPTPIFEMFSPDSKCYLLQNKKGLFLGKALSEANPNK